MFSLCHRQGHTDTFYLDFGWGGGDIVLPVDSSFIAFISYLLDN